MKQSYTLAGTIEKMGMTGNSRLVTIDGQGMFIGKEVDTSQWAVGKKISVEYGISEWKGKQNKWINAWAPVASAPSSSNGTASAGDGGMPEVSAGSIPPAHLACISNVLAHAIDAKALLTPSEIRTWVDAVNDALLKVPY